MRGIRRCLCALLTAALLFGCALVPASAAYTYTVRLYAGNRGTLGGQPVRVYTGLTYGERITFELEDVTLTDETYYVRGFRESGRDNDEVDAPSFTVTADRDYVVAYGVRGEQTTYTVRFVGADGSVLLPARTYHGNIGDKPVVAYRYVEGCRPQAYNQTKTLSENAAENVFEFCYDRVSSGTTPAQTAPGTENAGEQMDAAKDATPELLDLDPQPEARQTGAGERKAMPLWAWALLLCLLAAVVCGLLLTVRQRKRQR